MLCVDFRGRIDLYERRPNRAHPNPDHWRVIKFQAHKRDGFKCRTCGSEENLHAHHVTYDRYGFELLDDLLTLCQPCHSAITISVNDRRVKPRGSDIANIIKNADDPIKEITKILVKMNHMINTLKKSAPSGRSRARGDTKILHLVDHAIDFLCEGGDAPVLRSDIDKYLMDKHGAGRNDLPKFHRTIESMGCIEVSQERREIGKPGRPRATYKLKSIEAFEHYERSQEAGNPFTGSASQSV